MNNENTKNEITENDIKRSLYSLRGVWSVSVAPISRHSSTCAAPYSVYCTSDSGDTIVSTISDRSDLCELVEFVDAHCSENIFDKKLSISVKVA